MAVAAVILSVVFLPQDAQASELDMPHPHRGLLGAAWRACPCGSVFRLGRECDKVESQLWLVVQSSVIQDDSHEATELFNVRHVKMK